jgi:pimeloyl-ACP methyl ester carboxylesterase
MPGYSEELVHIQATDGVELAGAVIRPTGSEVKPLPIVYIHGFTGRFYEPHALAIGRRLAERGYVFITGNNRGDNYGSILRVRATGEKRLGGAAWEILEESPRDVDAWISYAVSRGFPEVALIGHSLGGMKVVYYLATRSDPRVKGLINASGPVWRFVGPAKEVAARLPEAERLVEQGRGLELLLPFPTDDATVSAQNVVGGRHFREVLFGGDGQPPAVARLSCPVFAFIGSEEEWLGVPADLEWFKETARSAPRCDTRYFAGADHVYAGHETEVADAIADWVDSLL